MLNWRQSLSWVSNFFFKYFKQYYQITGDVLRAISRDVTSSNIWEKYDNNYNYLYKYRYDDIYNNYNISDGGRDMYDGGNRVSKIYSVIFIVVLLIYIYIYTLFFLLFF